MKNVWRLSIVAAASSILASAFALHAAAGPPNHANRLEATFTETPASVTNRIADLGVFQLINTGTGTLEGFGPATETISVTQDRTVEPCGPGSWTNAAVSRITVQAGVLVLRLFAYVCPRASGPVATSTWEVDGAASTGAFAGARGSGEGSVDLATRTSNFAGTLKLVSGGN